MLEAARDFLGVVLLIAMTSTLAGCGSTREVPAPPAPYNEVIPLDRRLQEFATANNRQAHDVLAGFFATGARLQSPAMPRTGGAADYTRTLATEPFRMEISGTEILFANNLGAKTRSRVKMTSPTKYSLEEPMEVRWVFEGGQWRIYEMEFPAWSPLLGVWRKAGPRGEPSMELRLIPGGQYLVYAERDRTLPTFRGRYRIEGSNILLTDSSASESSRLNTEEGRYVVILTGAAADFRKVTDENRWRADRFEGGWTAGR
jgi:hypothetical protein